MARTINGDYQHFEFVTNSLRRLEIWGDLVSFQHRIETGVVEHLILKREGAIHQRPGVPPRKFSYRCVMIGANVGDRYRALADAISEDPTGRLIDPRFGSVRAVCLDVTQQEDPEQATDRVAYSLSFAESGLRTSPRENAGSIASRAQAQADQFVSIAPVSIATYAGALRSAVNTLTTLIATAVSLPQMLEARRAMGDVAAQAEAARTAARSQGLYDAGAQAALVRSAAQEALDRLDAQRPRPKQHYVPADISLARLCASLYGGRLARAMAAEIAQANVIRDPSRIPAGTWLTITDPEALRTHGAA